MTIRPISMIQLQVCHAAVILKINSIDLKTIEIENAVWVWVGSPYLIIILYQNAGCCVNLCKAELALDDNEQMWKLRAENWSPNFFFDLVQSFKVIFQLMDWIIFPSPYCKNW